jgi:uncharacterized membrane protein
MSEPQVDREYQRIMEKPHEKARLGQNRPPGVDLDTRMRKFSQIISAIALGLMVIGFISVSTQHLPLSTSVLPLSELFNFSQNPPGLVAMCLGIALLALLPALRVLLALILFIPKGVWVNILAAIMVLLELLFSLKIGG